MLNELAQEIHKNAVVHGFYDDDYVNRRVFILSVIEKIALANTELSEAIEAIRISKYAQLHKFKSFPMEERMADFNLLFKDFIKDSFEDELADCIIRVLDLCGFLNVDIDEFVKLKMQFNVNREHRHGKEC